MNREQKERLMEKIEYDIKSDMITQEEKEEKCLDSIKRMGLNVNYAAHE